MNLRNPPRTSKIAIDTCVLYDLICLEEEKSKFAANELKKALFAYDELVLLPPTLQELKSVISKHSRVLNTTRFTRLLHKNFFSLHRDYDYVIDETRSHDFKRIFIELNKKRRFLLSNYVDAQVLLLSSKLNMDILTFDKTLISLCESLFQSSDNYVINSVELPFPFTSTMLSEYDLLEIHNVADSFKPLFKSTILSLRSLDFERSLSREDNLQLKIFLEEQENIINSHSREMLRMKAKVERLEQERDIWKEGAKPDIWETAAFTTIDLGLLITGVPFSSAWLSHILHMKKYKTIQKRISNLRNE